MNKLNAVVHYVAMAIIGVVILCVLGMVYGTLKVKWAKKQVEAFEKNVVIGAPVAGMKKTAEDMHLNYRRFANSDDKNGKFYVWEGFVFSRWFCDVEYQDGKIKTKKVHYLD